ncbi:MAG: RdgB/HAM1 family non-canonical purine NTP pyrophosphatase [Bacteroidetes bacterium]|nr:RdgB/HAM1 family non-canonical purine NTP pyrophosphatase [Bacteroidota bacterium]
MPEKNIPSKIIFATNNLNKVIEIRQSLKEGFKILSLKEAKINIEIDEPFFTLEENALQKAKTIYELSSQPCFSEDTGLFAEALNGAPGVRSARFAGENASNEENIDKLLSLLPLNNRTAYFKTVVCYISKTGIKYFDGECYGKIITEKRGSKGFGYDSVFIPDGSEKTFAEMDIQEKNKFSHRKKAVDKFIKYLNG